MVTKQKQDPVSISPRLRLGQDDPLIWFLGLSVQKTKTRVARTKRSNYQAKVYRLFSLAERYLQHGYSGAEWEVLDNSGPSEEFVDFRFRISTATPTLYHYGSSLPMGPIRTNALRLLFNAVCTDIQQGTVKVAGLPGEHIEVRGIEPEAPEGGEAGVEQKDGAASPEESRGEGEQHEEEDYGPLGRASAEAIDALQLWGTDDWIEPPE